MATTGLTNQFKIDVLNGGHNFTTSTGNVYKFLLIKSGATGAYNNTLTNVGTPGSSAPSTSNVGTDEVTNTSGAAYVSGGFVYTAAQNTTAALFTNTACATFSVNPNWTSASFTAISGVLYNSSAGSSGAGRTVGNWDFGGAQTVSSGTFTVTLPTAGTTGFITLA